MTRFYSSFVAVLGVTIFLTACAGIPVTSNVQAPQTNEERRLEQSGKLGGGDGLLNEWLRGRSGTATGQGIGVNAYLWQASLDTLSFMPLASADSFGGVIITDWYQPNARSRYKLNVYILGREMRADTLRVASFKQTLIGGEWLADENTDVLNTQLENAILTRARQLRIDAAILTQ